MGTKLLGDLESISVIMKYSNPWRMALITFNDFITFSDPHHKELEVTTSRISDKIKLFGVYNIFESTNAILSILKIR